MKFKLKTLVYLVALLGLIIALTISARTVRLQRTELNSLRRTLPNQVEKIAVDVVVKMEAGGTWRYTKVLEFPSRQNRTFNDTFHAGHENADVPSLNVSVCLVGDIELLEGEGQGRVRTQGYLVAIRISKNHESTGEPTETTTEFVVYDGAKLTAYDHDGIKITLKPPLNQDN